MTDEWTRAEKRKAQSEQAKAIMDFVSMLSDKINELEKEKQDHRDNYEQFKAIAYPEIERLKKENAEQKETVIKMNQVITETFSNLTKAKKLLEKLLITSCNSDVLILFPNCSEVLRVRVEAEQFLKEIEI